jgi:cutinase
MSASRNECTRHRSHPWCRGGDDGTLLTASIAIPSASADPCSDVQVVFARGTNEPPGIGTVGQALVDSLVSQVGGRSVGVHAVDYPATDDFGTSAWVGANDAGSAAQYFFASCPKTKLVLGGYSQGAGVIDLASTAMPPQVADHVAAVALFGNPSSTFATKLFGGGSFPPSARCTAGRPLTCAFPTIQYAPKARTRSHTFCTSSPG